MTHTFKIKETAKSKSLIAHLQTLSYVEHVEDDSRRVLTDAEMAAKVKKAEKSKEIPFDEFVKITATWKDKVKKS